MIDIYFTDDEMAGFLLARGYVIMVAVEEIEINQYQNVFKTKLKEVVKAFKGDYSEDLEIAFKKEMKNQLLKL